MDASTSRLLRGFLEPCLLSLLAERADYGLSLSRRLTVSGLEAIPGGTLYPALMRLEKRGLVAVSWHPSTSGPARKYYELTEAGRTELAARRTEWRTFSTAVGGLIEGRTARAEASS
ncbi:PadR family transcriptional regulator [uncultured Actinomyces sp.]|uniref:PadR family transcriptional regulator n=1 Tax=uncultured Actinomyces sp. TaxID=249061 RepID=UPI0028D83AEE|nr:PadR family transcriptional regulator [uncultured Actinomyces sp.]